MEVIFMDKTRFEEAFEKVKEDMMPKSAEELVKKIMGERYKEDGQMDAAVFSVCAADYCMRYTNTMILRVLSEVLFHEPS